MAARRIKAFSDGSNLEYDQGKFDDWCVYLTRPGVSRHPPRDIEYFERFRQLGQAHSNKTIYDDYVQIYERTTAALDLTVLSFITDLTSGYGSDSLDMDILLTIVYAGMVAEENKKNTVLKKRIKRLGMHQVLMEGASAHYAATFSKGKKWRELDEICKRNGF